MKRKWLFPILLLATVATAVAQDTRKVAEPTIPPVCRSLDAKLSTSGEGLAEADEGRNDTSRIQQAIDDCRPGSAVELRPTAEKNAFLSGPLELRQGVTLLIRGGMILFASRNAGDYDIKPGTCGTVDHSGTGCRPLIRVNVHDAAVMGDGIIDGRGGARLIGRDISWWDLAEQAKSNRVRIESPGHNSPHLLEANNADGLILYRVTLRNSPHFHVFVHRTNGFTAWSVKIHSPETARNTDGIDPSSSTNVSILHSYIYAGDDHIAIKASASAPSTHMTIAHNHLYAGHGMSIGSGTQGGVSDIAVHDLTIQGARHGLHIKSSPNRGGVVRRVSYTDVCMQDVENPISFDTRYKGVTVGGLVPQYEDILLRDVRIRHGGTISLNGFDDDHPLRVTFDGVVVTDQAPKIRAMHTFITTGPGEVNFATSGNGVIRTAVRGRRKVPSCGNFVAFPAVIATAR